MNQGKLAVFNQEMLRVNTDILGISELRWTGMGEFNSDDHNIYCCAQQSLRRNGVALTVNTRVQNAVLGYNLQNDRKIAVCFQGKPLYITVIQVYALTNMLLEISAEITPERMKGWNQSKDKTQLWVGLMIEARFDAIESNIA